MWPLIYFKLQFFNSFFNSIKELGSIIWVSIINSLFFIISFKSPANSLIDFTSDSLIFLEIDCFLLILRFSESDIVFCFQSNKL